MDEKAIMKALELSRNLDGVSRRRDKFPVRLPGELDVILLARYGAAVNGRGVVFIPDDHTVGKVEKVAAWMKCSPRKGLLLFGTLGNGKTTMLRALKSYLGGYAVYCSAQDVYDYFRKNMCLPDISPGEVLLLDDLGGEAPTLNDFGTMRSPLAELLLSRYSSDSTTIITSNLSGSQIESIYGDRVGDRFREMFESIRYTHPSYR